MNQAIQVAPVETVSWLTPARAIALSLTVLAILAGRAHDPGYIAYAFLGGALWAGLGGFLLAFAALILTRLRKWDYYSQRYPLPASAQILTVSKLVLVFRRRSALLLVAGLYLLVKVDGPATAATFAGLGLGAAVGLLPLTAYMAVLGRRNSLYTDVSSTWLSKRDVYEAPGLSNRAVVAAPDLRGRG